MRILLINRPFLGHFEKGKKRTQNAYEVKSSQVMKCNSDLNTCKKKETKIETHL